MTMQEAIRRRTGLVEGVIKCYPYESLETIIDRIVGAEVCVFLLPYLNIKDSLYRTLPDCTFPRSIGWSWWTRLTR